MVKHWLYYARLELYRDFQQKASHIYLLTGPSAETYTCLFCLIAIVNNNRLVYKALKCTEFYFGSFVFGMPQLCT